MKPWELGYLVPSFLRAGDNLGDYRRLFYGPGDGFQNNPGFPRAADEFSKTRETRLNAKRFWPRAQPKCARGQPQAISDRPRGQPRRYATKERGSTAFRVWPFRSQPPPRSMRSPTRCGHPPTTKPVRAVRWVCTEPHGRLRPLKTLEIIAPRRPHRGRRGTN